ncbi:MAG: triose-phosphate isomerase [Bacteroidales bacterium]|nr:triose-phosphate isomerase [Bacteroidales bacterium]
MRKKIVAGNWKMNPNYDEAIDLLNFLKDNIPTDHSGVDIIICPPFIYLIEAKKIFNRQDIYVGAQNVSSFTNGAYTGEISAAMLKSININYTIIGHSERRQYFGEKEENFSKKIKLCLQEHITPIYCVGETLEQRNNGEQLKVVEKQISEALYNLSDDEIAKIIIAYEPVWAIGTGVNATPDQAQQMHVFIRELIAKKYNQTISQGIIILYGGSVKASNAKELFSMPDIDGGLIGGASLKGKEFTSIINIAMNI